MVSLGAATKLAEVQEQESEEVTGLEVAIELEEVIGVVTPSG
jgi:hypothetical protein